VTQNEEGFAALINLCLLKGWRVMTIARESNGVGAGALLGQPLSPEEVLWNSDVKGLFIYEDDPFHYLNQERVKKAFTEKEFILVGDVLPSMSTEAAHLVVATGAYSEKEGTRFAGDGYLRRVKRAFSGGPDGFLFLRELLARLGGAYYKSANDVTERLRIEGIIQREADGAERLKVMKSAARFSTAPVKAKSSRDAFVLILRDIFRNHHIAGRDAFSKGIARVYEGTGYPIAEDKLYISPEDAERLGLQPGDKVSLASGTGSLEKAVTLKQGLKPGVVEYIVFRERAAVLALSDGPAKVINVTVRKA
jgi:anaerobic selenocysteine-containing dehydrogenase